MRSIILISEDRVKTVSNLDNNVFGKWLLPAIREAQDVQLQSIIGSTLYNQLLTLVDSGDIALPEYELYKDLLDNQIADFLVYQSLVNVIPLINVNMANMGTVISNDEHIQTLSQGNVDLVRGYYQNLADIYQKRLQDFLKCHREYFPELNECGCDNCGVKPNLNSNTNTSGIWLGGLRNPKKGFVSSECCGGSSKSSSGDCQEEYNKGYRDGERHQKSLLVSTAVTKNGVYERENGYSSISVNVPDRYEEGFESGYTSGETHQKSLLIATAVTANGTYGRSNGYSSIEVNVPTGSTINNQTKNIIVRQNGDQNIGYDSGYTGLESIYLIVEVPEKSLSEESAYYNENGVYEILPQGADGMSKVTVEIDVPQEGYTQEDLDNAYQSGVTDGENQQKAKLIATAVTANGTYSRENGYSSITVNVPQTGYTQEDLDNAYNRGYNDGLSDCAEQHIGVSDTNIEFPSSGDDKTVTIQSNTSWNVVSKPEWITVSPTSGTGDGSIIITASANTNYVREGNIVLQSLDSAVTVTISIRQLGDYTPSDYTKVPLGIDVLSNGEILWDASPSASGFTKTIEYRKNGGEWISITSTTEGVSISVISGDIVEFRGNNNAYANANGFNHLEIRCSAKVFGNIMSLINSTNYSGLTTLSNNYVFKDLFQNSVGLIDASNLVLPATTLTERCYDGMFYHCTSLTTAPALPATTLASHCYNHMFRYCTNLTTAPELPATTLANYCYRYMFEGCTSLTTAPELPATTLVLGCYQHMFNGCTNLNYIKCLATDISASICTNNWVDGVAATGTFIRKYGVSAWSRGVNGIPENWEVISDNS